MKGVLKVNKDLFDLDIQFSQSSESEVVVNGSRYHSTGGSDCMPCQDPYSAGQED